MADKVVSGPIPLRSERVFEVNRFAREHQQHAFDYLLEDVQSMDTEGPKQTVLPPLDTKEGVAA